MTPGAGIFRTKLPKGFFAAGINCGIRHYRPDIGLISSDFPCVAAGVFTQSSFKAAPVLYSEGLLPSNNIRAIVSNSGQANAATGDQGVDDNLAMAEAVASFLGCKAEQVLTASTGVIGNRMEINKIVSGVPRLVDSLIDIVETFATAILTTDLVPKTVVKELMLEGGKITITGVCKGSGMIHPNMATMLGFLLTDAVFDIEQSQKALKRACNCSFNMISVDGETSTNDSVFLLANGASGVFVQSHEISLVQEAFNEVAITLAKSIARDGEGATRLLTVEVIHAKDAFTAKKIARSLTVSPLIKTAIHGASPNWGRVMARLGMEQCENLENCKITFQGFQVYGPGLKRDSLSKRVKEKMKTDSVLIEVDLASGDASATAWGCDLSPSYVKINAEYLT